MAIDQVLIDKDKFTDFFRYYTGKPEQLTGVELLYFQFKASNPTLLAKNADWMEAYRGNNQPPPADKPTDEWMKPSEPVAAQWPLTKAQLGEIMLCSADSLPDSLMDDLAACCEDFGINTPLILGYFLGQCGHESAGLRYPMEIASGSAYEFRTDLGNVHAGDGVKYAGTGWIQSQVVQITRTSLTTWQSSASPTPRSWKSARPTPARSIHGPSAATGGSTTT